MSDFIYGVHPVTEALAANRRQFKKIFLSLGRSPKDIQKIVSRAQAAHIPVERVEERFFRTELKGVVHQGVAARTSALPTTDEGTILKKASQEDGLPLVVALDGIEDPQNLGSIVRSALAMGVHGVVLPKTRTAPLSAAASKASAGAMEHMPFVKVSNLVAALNRFKEKGLWIVGTDSKSNACIDGADLNLGMVLVVGGEGKGIRPLVRRTCDLLVSVPQSDQMDSLNAAVATAIVLYEIARQRRAGTVIGR